MTKNPQIGVSGTDYYLIDEAGRRLADPIGLYQNLPNLLRWQLFFTSPLAHPTVMFRREVINLYGRYDPEYLHAEDYELWLRLSPFVKFGILSEPLVSIRIHDNNVSQIHAREQSYNATKAAQKAISEFLGKEINFELIRGLRNFHYVMDSSEAVELADLLQQIYRKLKSICIFTAGENKHIQNDILTWMTEYFLICLKEHSCNAIFIWKQLFKIKPKDSL